MSFSSPPQNHFWWTPLLLITARKIGRLLFSPSSFEFSRRTVWKNERHFTRGYLRGTLQCVMVIAYLRTHVRTSTRMCVKQLYARAGPLLRGPRKKIARAHKSANERKKRRYLSQLRRFSPPPNFPIVKLPSLFQVIWVMEDSHEPHNAWVTGYGLKLRSVEDESGD